MLGAAILEAAFLSGLRGWFLVNASRLVLGLG